jgi:hypothetical protein
MYAEAAPLTSTPRLGSRRPHLHRNWAQLATSTSGLSSPMPHPPRQGSLPHLHSLLRVPMPIYRNARATVRPSFVAAARPVECRDGGRATGIGGGGGLPEVDHKLSPLRACVAEDTSTTAAVVAAHDKAELKPADGIRDDEKGVPTTCAKSPSVPARFAFADFLVKLPRRTAFARAIAGRRACSSVAATGQCHGREPSMREGEQAGERFGDPHCTRR